MEREAGGLLHSANNNPPYFFPPFGRQRDHLV